MIVRKLRLQRGWSQEHLSQVSGLSVRTIQRIERGQTAGLESLKSLAAVFDVNITDLTMTDLTKEPDMSDAVHVNQQEERNPQVTLAADEERAMQRVRDIKGFYGHLRSYLTVIAMLFVINLLTDASYIWAIWPALGWGIGILNHGLSVFEVFSYFSPAWEKKQVEKQLGRKL